MTDTLLPQTVTPEHEAQITRLTAQLAEAERQREAAYREGGEASRRRALSVISRRRLIARQAGQYGNETLLAAVAHEVASALTPDAAKSEGRE